MAFWEKICPEGAHALRNRQSPEHYPISNSKKEIQAWFHKIKLDHVRVLFVFGLSKGYPYLAAQQWLQAHKSHVMAIIENDLDAIAEFMADDLASDFLTNPQAALYYCPNTNSLYKPAGDFTFLPMKVVSTPIYQTTKAKACHLVGEALTRYAAVHAQQSSEYAGGGRSVLKNFYHNAMQLPWSHWAGSLVGSCHNVPAIICGAGPSLHKQAALFSKWKHRALLFAGGTAMNAMNAYGVKPHFGAGIDPNEAQYLRILANEAFAAPFFYKVRMNYQALRCVSGPRIFVPGESGYRVCDWLLGELGLHSTEWQRGYNVINACLAIACQLGCNPLIIIGVDLAYTEKQPYAAGLALHALHDPAVDFRTKRVEEPVIERTDIFGQPIKTLWKWELESGWYTQFAKEHPEKVIINATEGGLGFKGVPNCALGEVIEQHLTREYDLDALIQSLLAQSHMSANVTQEAIVNRFQLLLDSLERLIASNTILEDEFCYRNLLSDFDADFKKVHHHRRFWAADKQIIDDQRRRFLLQVAQINRDLLKEVLTDTYPQGAEPSPLMLPDNVQTFYPNGNLKRTVSYCDGLRHGQEEYYSPNQQLLIQANYQNGHPAGEAMQWNEQGQLVKKIVHQPGQPLQVRIWDHNGQEQPRDTFWEQASAQLEVIMASAQEKGLHDILVKAQNLKDKITDIDTASTAIGVDQSTAIQEKLSPRHSIKKELESLQALLHPNKGERHG